MPERLNPMETFITETANRTIEATLEAEIADRQIMLQRQ